MTELYQDILLDTNGNNDELIFAHVDEVHWPEGFGQLINEGKREIYELGKYLRRRYNKLIGPKYSPNKVYVQSTNVDRTIMSAQVALVGLFPPTEEDKWHDDILWHPIPVHTMPFHLDVPKYDAVLEQHLKDSPEMHRFLTEHGYHFSLWSRESGMNIDTIEKVYDLHNTLTIEQERNKPLPGWASKAIESNGIMENIVKFYFKLGSNTRELAKIKSGPLIKEMIERFSHKINSTQRPDRSLWLYSAHNFTISNVLNSLGLFEPHLPPTAASLHFELYKSAKGEHYVQILYRKMNEEYPLPMKIPECGDKCTLEQFYDLYNDIIPEQNSD